MWVSTIQIEKESDAVVVDPLKGVSGGSPARSRTKFESAKHIFCSLIMMVNVQQTCCEMLNCMEDT